MNVLNDIFFRANAEHLSEEEVFFLNLNLDAEALRSSLLPVTEMICHRIENTYRSPAKIALLGTNPRPPKSIRQCMQFEDICLKFLHIGSSLPIFLILSSRLARTLLTRLLASPLIDDASSLPLSSTEQGIFSFIIVRLLFDIKNVFKERMPDLKLVGVYHAQDEMVNDIEIMGFGVYNFSFTFAADYYPIAIAVPKELFKTFKRMSFTKDVILARCGHLKRPLISHVVTLTMSQKTLTFLSSNDLIIFDRSTLSLKRGELTGSVSAIWDNYVVLSHLSVQNSVYQLVLSHNHFSEKEDLPLEELKIAYAKDQEAINGESHTDKLLDLAHNIRVALSIEISRVPMTLTEICQLRSGEIIDLHRKIDDPLEMRVEDKIIGYCQPVQIEGRLGIRVLRINGVSKEDV